MTKQERAALALVNKIRRAEGRKPLLKLPKGVPEAAYQCPIARALNGGQVGVGDEDALIIPANKLVAYLRAGLKLDGDTVALRLPRQFEYFLAWFDNQQDEAAKALNAQPEEES